MSSNPAYEYGNLDAHLREFAAGPTGKRDLYLPGHAYPFKVLVSQFPAKDLRPPLRFTIAIDTANFRATCGHHLLMALISLAFIGVVLASLLGFCRARSASSR